MFDGLDEYKLEDTTTFQLALPNGKFARAPTGETDGEGKPVFEDMTITVRRASSAVVQRFVNKRKNQQIQALRRAKSISAESITEDAVAMLTFCVVAWTGFLNAGKPVECNKLNVRNLLDDDAFIWIREQIDRVAGDDSSYLGNS